MVTRPAYVIVGASLAGGTAAATLRAEGFDGRVVLIGAEPLPPYERPPLSKEFLRGEVPFERAFIRPPEFWAEQEIECRFGCAATRIDPRRRRVHLAGGEEVAYDKLLIATGLRNRTLAVPGGDLPGVHTLRTVADAEAIQRAVATAQNVVVVGMGFIGAEVAATLRTKGLDVAVVEPLPTPAHRALGPEVGGVLAAIHRDHGVRMHFGQAVAAVEGHGRAERVVTTSGLQLACDLVVVGVGTVPVTDPLEGSGIALDDGVQVDETCRASVEGIFAAGDIANHAHPAFGRLRLEHWNNALKQGAAAARSMLGGTDPYDEVPWFWSDQYGDNLQSAGRPGPFAQAVVRGDVAARRFAAFTLTAGRITGAVAVNRGRDIRRALALIKGATPVDPAVLADPERDVRDAARP